MCMLVPHLHSVFVLNTDVYVSMSPSWVYFKLSVNYLFDFLQTNQIKKVESTC